MRNSKSAQFPCSPRKSPHNPPSIPCELSVSIFKSCMEIMLLNCKNEELEKPPGQHEATSARTSVKMEIAVSR